MEKQGMLPRIVALAALALAMQGCTPAIIKAIDRDKPEEVKAILDRARDKTRLLEKSWANMYWGTTPEYPLARAAGEGRIEEVKLLLDAGADANYCGPYRDDGVCPLVIAALGNHLEVARLLLDHGANPDINSGPMWLEGFYNDGNTPHTYRSPLHHAAALGNVDMARLLLERGADPRFRDPRDETAMDIAAGHRWNPKGDYDGVIALLKKADDPEKFALRKARLAKRKSDKAALAARRADIQAAEKAGDEAQARGKLGDALDRFSEALKLVPPGAEPDMPLRKKIIAVAHGLDQAPPVPEDAESHSNQGQSMIKRAQGPADFEMAVGEFRQATLAAPWWPAGYYNLGLALEKSEDFAGAIDSLKLYLLAAPNAADAKAVRRKIDDLTAARKLADQKGRVP